MKSIAEQVAERTGKLIGSWENFNYLLDLAANQKPVPKEPLKRKKESKTKAL